MPRPEWRATWNPTTAAPQSGHRSVAAMIFSDVPDPRLVTIRRGGTLTDADHHLLAVWAADCAEHVLHYFEQARPGDERPRRAIELARAWARGEIRMTEARTAAGHANGAARDLSGAAARSVRGRPGWRGGACGRPRTGCGGVRDQGCARGGTRWRARRGGSPRVPVAARSASQPHSGPRPRRPAAAQR